MIAVRWLCVTQKVDAGTVTVTFEDVGGQSEVTVTYELTALTDAANAHRVDGPIRTLLRPGVEHTQQTQLERGIPVADPRVDQLIHPHGRQGHVATFGAWPPRHTRWIPVRTWTGEATCGLPPVCPHLSPPPGLRPLCEFGTVTTPSPFARSVVASILAACVGFV